MTEAIVRLHMVRSVLAIDLAKNYSHSTSETNKSYEKLDIQTLLSVIQFLVQRRLDELVRGVNM
jgi:hypothetical protein